MVVGIKELAVGRAWGWRRSSEIGKPDRTEEI
jgi:hypothetical protein